MQRSVRVFMHARTRMHVFVYVPVYVQYYMAMLVHVVQRCIWSCSSSNYVTVRVDVCVFMSCHVYVSLNEVCCACHTT